MHINRWFWHLLFWLLIMVIGTATIYPYHFDIRLAIIDRAIFLPVWLIATYVNWWVLIPRYFAKKQWRQYFSILFSLILVLTIIQRYLCLYYFYPAYFWETEFDPDPQQAFLIGKMIQFGAFIALPVFCSIGIRMLLDWYEESYKAKQIIAAQKAAELNYLKAQINPHFLFNTLNSLYGLSLEGSKKVPQLILKLSDLLSYSLYESNVERISLTKEIALIHDFIELEKERYGDRMEVKLNVSPDLEESIEIAPLLLIPLVENAFKHGVKEATQTIPIDIQLEKQGNELIFEVKNKVPVQSELDQSSQNGLGLKNLGRRLDLLYPQKHNLSTQLKEDVFCAQLKLKLDD